MSKIYKELEKAERERGVIENEPLAPVIEDLVMERPKIIPEPERIEKGGYDPRLITLSDPGSVAAEQFRKLRTKIHRLNVSTGLRTVMVTSSTNGEGKSFITANLGVTLARDLHTRALLVDCDLRNPTLTNWFGLQNGNGLSNYLKGNNGFGEFSRETGIEKLSIVTAGSIENNPTELIGSNRMKALVEDLGSRDKSQIVIFDSTPLLSTSEAEVLGKLVDGIIFVVRAGVTPRETVQRAMAGLGKEKILGVVLNDLKFKSPGLRARYFGGNGYYYGYGYGRKPPQTKGRLKRALHSMRGRKQRE